MSDHIEHYSASDDDGQMPLIWLALDRLAAAAERQATGTEQLATAADRLHEKLAELTEVVTEQVDKPGPW